MKWLDSIKNGTFKDYARGSIGGLCMKAAEVKPEIMLIVGGVSVLVGTIHAIKKAEEGKAVLQSAKENMEAVDAAYKAVKESVGEDKNALQKAKLDAGKSYVTVMASTLYALCKVWGVSALLWFGGMGLIFDAHKEVRKIGKYWLAHSAAIQQAFDEYRRRNAALIGPEAEQKLFLGAEPGVVQVLEVDEATGEEKIVEKSGDIFINQPGSVFARNFTEETSDAFDIRAFADHYLAARVKRIKDDIKLGIARAYSGVDVLRMLGYNEDAIFNDPNYKELLRNGITCKGPELEVTSLEGYREVYDHTRDMKLWKPCLRLDFNFYPMEGMI